jgi:hypothetical protein
MTQTDPAFLRRQLLETDRLAALHEKDSFMAMAWANRRQSLLEELAEAEARAETSSAPDEQPPAQSQEASESRGGAADVSL